MLSVKAKAYNKQKVDKRYRPFMTKSISLNYRSLQTDDKINFGSGGSRKVKVSLAKLNLPPILEE